MIYSAVNFVFVKLSGDVIYGILPWDSPRSLVTVAMVMSVALIFAFVALCVTRSKSTCAGAALPSSAEDETAVEIEIEEVKSEGVTSNPVNATGDGDDRV